MDSEKNHDKWCKIIAESKSLDELITHFREHVCEHYDRHNRQGELGMYIWVVGVFNFMYILEKKFPQITKEDMLFKLCTYHKNHPENSPEPPFDINKFLDEYSGEIKKYHKYKK